MRVASTRASAWPASTARRRTSSTATPASEHAGNSNLGLIEVDGYFIRGDWTVQGQLSYGYQKDAAITANANGGLQTASWYGLSTLAAYKFTPRFEGVGRFDYLNNGKNGGGLLGYGIDDGNGIGPERQLGCVQGAAAVDPGATTAPAAMPWPGPELRVQPVHDVQGRGALRLGQPAGLPERRRQQLQQEQHRARRFGGGVLLILCCRAETGRHLPRRSMPAWAMQSAGSTDERPD